jgi:hypothetical protein
VTITLEPIIMNYDNSFSVFIDPSQVNSHFSSAEGGIGDSTIYGTISDIYSGNGSRINAPGISTICEEYYMFDEVIGECIPS